MLETLFRHVLLPAFDSGLKRRKTFRYWRELERSQWIDQHSLRALQLTRLQDLLRHAASNCDYYRDTWREHGLAPERVDGFDDFTRWPLLDRTTVRENRQAMRSRSAVGLITKSTGGSSGMPLTFDLDPDSNDRRTAAWHRGYDWASAGPGSRQFLLWGVDLRARSLRQRVKERLWNRLHRKSVFSSFDLTRENCAHVAERIAICAPQAIVAYVKPLYELARCLEEAEIVPYAPASIVVGAEKLHPFERDTIQRVFRAPVFETYGSREFMLIGAECECHRGLHITSEHLLVELLDEDGRPVPAGDEGEVVITDLFNYGMPFIRYRTGDRAVASEKPCPCGRSLPMLSRVVGRQLDVIRTPDGRLIPGEFFPHLMKDFRQVREFQVVQTADDCLTVRLVTENGLDAMRGPLSAIIQQQLGSSMRVQFEDVPFIPLTAAGKRRVVVNQSTQSKAA